MKIKFYLPVELFLHYFEFSVCVCMCAHACLYAHMLQHEYGKSKQFPVFDLFFSQNQTKDFELCGQDLYSLAISQSIKAVSTLYNKIVAMGFLRETTGIQKSTNLDIVCLVSLVYLEFLICTSTSHVLRGNSHEPPCWAFT